MQVMKPGKNGKRLEAYYRKHPERRDRVIQIQGGNGMDACDAMIADMEADSELWNAFVADIEDAIGGKL